MSDSGLLVLVVGILIVMFYGDPDLHDALISYLMKE